MLRRLCLVVVFLAVYLQASEIRELDAKDFNREVLQSDRLWLVASSDVDGAVVKELNKVARATLGVFNIAQSVDKANKGGLLRFYGENKEEPIQYSDAIQSHNIIDFLFVQTQNVIDSRGKEAKEAKLKEEQDALEAERAQGEADEEAKIREKSDTIIVTKEKFNQLFQSREPFLLNAYSSKCADCRALNKEWEKVTDEIRDRVKVAKVNLTEHDDLEDILKVTVFPTILYFPAGIKSVDKVERYDGFKRSKPIIDWALKELTKPVESSIDHLTADLYNSVCRNAKGTCVIFFAESETSPELQKLSSLPKTYTGKPISFFYLLKGEQPKLAQQFGVSSYPNTLLIYTTRKTSWVLNHLEPAKVEEAVGEAMLGNRNNFVKFKFEEILV